MALRVAVRREEITRIIGAPKRPGLVEPIDGVQVARLARGILNGDADSVSMARDMLRTIEDFETAKILIDAFARSGNPVLLCSAGTLEIEKYVIDVYLRESDPPSVGRELAAIWFRPETADYIAGKLAVENPEALKVFSTSYLV